MKLHYTRQARVTPSYQLISTALDHNFYKELQVQNVQTKKHTMLQMSSPY